MNRTDDLLLIERFKEGDPSVFADIVQAYQDRINNLTLYMLGNTHDAEDAAQDTFVKAYRGLKNFTPRATLYTWLYRIAVNTCLDYRRRPLWKALFRKADREESLFPEPASPLPSPEKLAASKQAGAAIRASLGRLSDKLRVVIILKEVEGLSYEEIGRVLEISSGTVKSRISRARAELRKMLRPFTEHF